MKWFVGFLFSCLFIWTLSAFLLDSAEPWVSDSELGYWVHAPGVVQHRSEGWGETHFGEGGLLERQVSLAKSDTPKVFLLGDSYVEALQVDDQEKIAVVYNQLVPDSAPKLIGFGGSGFSLEHYVSAMDVFQRRFPAVRGYAIVLSGLGDLDIGPEGDRFVRLSEGGGQPFASPSIYSQRFAAFLNKWQLNFSLPLFRSLRDIFSESAAAPLRTQAGGGDIPHVTLEEGWAPLFEEIKKVTDRKVIFVYMPSAPAPEGDAVLFRDKEGPNKNRFKTLCQSYGVAFVDMTEPFVDYYLTTGHFPRGFFNSPPGRGHLNAEGQRMVADVLARYFEGGI